MRKLVAIGAALALVFAVAFVVAGDGSAVACNKDASAKNASASLSCKSAAATTASASCSRSAAAKTASACCSSKNAVAGYTKAEKKQAKAEEAAARTAALKEITDPLPYKNNKRVVVTGSMQCGSCSYKATAACAPLFKTIDGKVYALIQNGKWEAMHKSGADTFEVSTRVTKRSGMKYLEVVAFKAL